jgi:hypothetical protein
MLLPALARGKYLARLTTCTSDLRQQGIGLTSLAGDNDDTWLERTVYASGNRQPNLLRNGGSDDRQLLDEAVGIESTNCLFIGKSPYDVMTTNHGSFTLAGYEYWVGAEIDSAQIDSGMKRVGDTMEWTSGTNTYEFDILVTDTDRMRWTSNSVELSHPDSAGLVPLQLVDIGYYLYMYFSWNGVRGYVDRNFLHTDGSVNRMMRVQNPTASSWDSRLVRVPYQSNNAGDSASGYLPTVN